MKYDIGRQLLLDGYLRLHLKPCSLMFNQFNFNCVIKKWKENMLADESPRFLSKHSILRCIKNVFTSPSKNHCLKRQNYSSSKKSKQANDESVLLYKRMLDQDEHLNTNK